MSVSLKVDILFEDRTPQSSILEIQVMPSATFVSLVVALEKQQ